MWVGVLSNCRKREFLIIKMEKHWWKEFTRLNLSSLIRLPFVLEKKKLRVLWFVIAITVIFFFIFLMCVFFLSWFVIFLGVWFLYLYVFIVFNRSKMETMRYELFQVFERREYIHKDDLPILTDYICGNLNLISHLTGVIIMSNITTLISYK